MYRFLLKPKWIAFHLLCIALVVLMVNLGFWQLHRLESRKDFNAQVTERAGQPAAPFDQVVPAGVDPADVEWRHVLVGGEYLADEQLIEINRGQGGQVGVNLVTPLRFADGSTLLVNRGFVASPDLTAATAPAPPAGSIEIEGRVRVSEERSFGGFTEPSGQLTEIQRIDIPRLTEQLPAPVQPVYIDLIAAKPAQDASIIPVPEPELGEGPHLSYMLQWWFFALCVVIGWVLAVRRSAKQHQRDRDKALSEGVGAAAADSPLPSDDAPTTAPIGTPGSSLD